MPTFSLQQKHADLESEQAKLLARLALENPNAKLGRPPSAMQQRNEASLRGLPAIGPAAWRHRAVAGMGQTDPWAKQRERDYKTRSGQAIHATRSMEQILAASDNRCYLCHIPLSLRTMQIDHIIPLAHGGTHTDDNIAAGCLICNARKGARFVSFTIATRKPIYTR